MERALQPSYPGTCRNIDPADEAARRAAPRATPARFACKIPERPIRFHDMVRGAVEFPSEVVSDPIIVRSTGMPVYNYVVVIDDARDADHARHPRRRSSVEHA